MNDRTVKFLPKSPMIGLIDKTPMLWGPSNGAFGPDLNLDAGIPGSLKEFKKWQSAHKYDGIDKLENIVVNARHDGLVDSTMYDGSEFFVASQKKCFMQAFFPYLTPGDLNTVFEGNTDVDGVERVCPVTTMRRFIRCVGPEIMKGVENNSRYEVLNGEHISLASYTRSMLERHGKVADINETLQAFQVLRAFSFGKMNSCRSTNSFDNVMRVLKEFKIAHPAGDEYPRGTTIGNVESIRQIAYKSESIERWSPFSDVMAVFFVVCSIGKEELTEIVKLIA